MEFGFWSLEFGVWILDFGVWILDLGFWILEFGFWSLDFGFWISLVFVLFVAAPNGAVWILEFGFWILGLDYNFLASFGSCIRYFPEHRIMITIKILVFSAIDLEGKFENQDFNQYFFHAKS